MTVKRRTVTIKLHPKNDADLVAWWDALERGTFEESSGRQRTAKATMRAALGFVLPPESDEAAVLRAELETAYKTIDALTRRIDHQHDRLEQLTAAVSNIPRLIGAVKTSGSTPADDTRLKELERQLAWAVDTLNWFIEHGAPAAADSPDPDEPTSTAQLSDDELREREDRLNKADW